MKINLDDNKLHLRFAPLTLTRPLGNLRMGILCNNERWKIYIPEAEIGFTTEKYLQEKFIKLTAFWNCKCRGVPFHNYR